MLKQPIVDTLVVPRRLERALSQEGHVLQPRPLRQGHGGAGPAGSVAARRRRRHRPVPAPRAGGQVGGAAEHDEPRVVRRGGESSRSGEHGGVKPGQSTTTTAHTSDREKKLPRRLFDVKPGRSTPPTIEPIINVFLVDFWSQTRAKVHQQQNRSEMFFIVDWSVMNFHKFIVT